MNAFLVKLTRRMLCVGVAAAWAGAASAQTGGPMVGIETIPHFILPPGGFVEQFFPNVFDPNHPKKLTFTGTLGNDDPANAPLAARIWFDWIDPSDPTAPKTSPPEVYTIVPGQPRQIMQMYLIPFCPPQVSIHIQNDGPGAPLFGEGTFIHECIPEPGTGVMAAVGAAGALGAARRRRR